MTFVRTKFLSVGLISLCCFSALAQAGDVVLRQAMWEDTTAGGSVVGLSAGAMTGLAHEYVYDPNTGIKVSELDWKMNVAETLNLDVSSRITSKLRGYFNGTIGFNGDNYMDDYDWISSTPPAAASDHSWHDDTRLDHYFSFDAGARYSLANFDTNTFSVLGGMHYTDVQWSAYGGCLNYTSPAIGGPIAGCLTPGLKGITYQQTLPAAYTGIGFEHVGDVISASLVATGGVSFGSDQDHHWLRSLLFQEFGKPTPYLGARAKVTYALNNRSSLFIKGDYQNYFEMQDGYSAGLSLETLNVSLGGSVRF